MQRLKMQPGADFQLQPALVACITTALLAHFKRSVIHIDLKAISIMPGIRVDQFGGGTQAIINKLASCFKANLINDIYWSFESDERKEGPICNLNIHGDAFDAPISIKLHQEVEFAKLSFLADDEINGNSLILVLRKIVNDLAARDVADLSDQPKYKSLYPLSGMQQIFLTACNSPDNEPSVYHTQCSYHLRIRNLDLDLFVYTVKVVLYRHPVLRTVFILDDQNKYQQTINADLDISPVLQDISLNDITIQEQLIQQLLLADRNRPLQVLDPRTPNFRSYIIKRSHDSLTLFFSSSHAVWDGWSLTVLLKEIFATYQLLKTDRAFTPSPAPYQYLEFLKYEQEVSWSAAARQFWQQHLSAHRAFVPRRIRDTPEGDSYKPIHLQLDGHLVNMLDELRKRSMVPLKAIFISVFVQLIARETGLSNNTIGVVTNGRTPHLSDPLNTLGLLWNLAPMCLADMPDKTAHYKYINTKVSEINKFGSYPLKQIIEDGNHDSLFHAVFNFINFENAGILPTDNSIEFLQIDMMDKFHYPLQLLVGVNPFNRDITLVMNFDSRCYNADEITGMLNQFLSGLYAACGQASPTAVGKLLNAFPGPKFNRNQLEVLASGKISTILGPLFEDQDQYALQIRLPQPPYLLCDRVTGIKGELGSLTTGTIWTETDVTENSWYLINGKMPPGILSEASQGFILLAAYLGIGLKSKGEKVLRLISCESTLHGELPKIGETLKFEIRISGYATIAETILIFFNYDCYINDKLRVSAKNGQAGFFVQTDLFTSPGIAWDAPKASYMPAFTPVFEKATTKTIFSNQDIKHYYNGNFESCFGRELLWTKERNGFQFKKNKYPNLLQNITVFDVTGGPAKRGYMRSETAIDPDAWFFKAHFKNDPCMPATIMADIFVQMIGFYMIGIGITPLKDGGSFEPVPIEKNRIICKGQVTPLSKLLVYEVFMDEIIEGSSPIIYAHLLATVDGVKAFLIERLGIRLLR